MKIVKKFLVFILGFILVNLFGCLVLSFSIKEILQENIISNVVKESLVENFTSEMDIEPAKKEEIKKVIDNPEVNEIVSSIVDELMLTLSDENKQFDAKVIDDLLDHIIENKGQIEEAIGTTIDISEFEELRNSEEYKQLTQEISDTFNESSVTMDENSKTAIKLYGFITSNNFRIIIVILMVINIILIMLIQWSLYNWFAILGRAMVTTGVSLLIISLLINNVITSLLAEENITVDISMNNLTVFSIISLIIGLILIIVRKIINNYMIKKDNKEEVEIDEVSTVS